MISRGGFLSAWQPRVDADCNSDPVTRGRLQERMNSPLQLRKVRLRGLGGPAVYGVPRACASAAGKECDSAGLSGAVETAATTAQSPPARTRRPGRVRRPTRLRVRSRGIVRPWG